MKNTKNEELLNCLSIALFYIGMVLGIICLCYCDISEIEHIGSSYGCSFNATLFVTGIFSIIGCIVQYAFFRVIIEISLSLKGGISLPSAEDSMKTFKDSFKYEQ